MAGYTEKVIKSICRKKIDDLCNHIRKNDKDLANDLKRHCFISGGAITSLLQGEQPNDYDIYIDNINTLYNICVFYTNQWNENHETKKEFNIIKHITDDTETNNNYYLKTVKDVRESVEIQVKSTGIVKDGAFEEDEDEDEDENLLPSKELIEDVDNVKEEYEEKYVIKCITSNALSLSDEVQIICRFCGKPEEIFKNYDFVHTTQAYVRCNDELLLNTKSLVSIMSKRLEYQGSLFPVCSLFRLRKFLSRGWTISSMEILKIAYQISKLDLDDIKVLREQLCGVDFFYLSAFCVALQDWRENNPDIEFNSMYMFKLIEEVFDKDYTLKEENNE